MGLTERLGEALIDRNTRSRAINHTSLYRCFYSQVRRYAAGSIKKARSDARKEYCFVPVFTFCIFFNEEGLVKSRSKSFQASIPGSEPERWQKVQVSSSTWKKDSPSEKV